MTFNIRAFFWYAYPVMHTSRHYSFTHQVSLFFVVMALAGSKFSSCCCPLSVHARRPGRRQRLLHPQPSAHLPPPARGGRTSRCGRLWISQPRVDSLPQRSRLAEPGCCGVSTEVPHTDMPEPTSAGGRGVLAVNWKRKEEKRVRVLVIAFLGLHPWGKKHSVHHKPQWKKREPRGSHGSQNCFMMLAMCGAAPILRKSAYTVMTVQCTSAQCVQVTDIRSLC